jgi:hypothetical protein
MSIIGTTPNGVPIISSPDSSLLESVEFSMNDSVATVTSLFTGQVQAQQWPGGDNWSGTMTFPPLLGDEADEVISFFGEARGMANCFFMSDPTRKLPNGAITGANPITVDMGNSGTNFAGAQVLYTKGWPPSSFGQLLPGDYLQLGNRLHRVLSRVNPDDNGKAQLSIWPSLREVPTDGQSVILNNPQGLFRLAVNKRTWSVDVSYLTRASYQIVEFR